MKYYERPSTTYIKGTIRLNPKIKENEELANELMELMNSIAEHEGRLENPMYYYCLAEQYTVDDIGSDMNIRGYGAYSMVNIIENLLEAELIVKYGGNNMPFILKKRSELLLKLENLLEDEPLATIEYYDLDELFRRATYGIFDLIILTDGINCELEMVRQTIKTIPYNYNLLKNIFDYNVYPFNGKVVKELLESNFPEIYDNLTEKTFNAGMYKLSQFNSDYVDLSMLRYAFRKR